MELPYALGLAVVLAVLLLILNRQVAALRNVSSELLNSVNSLKAHVETVNRLARHLQLPQNQPAGDPRAGLPAGPPEGGNAASAPAELPHAPSAAGEVVIVHDEGQAPFESVLPGTPADYQKLYAAWCNGARQPSHLDLVEVSALRYAGEERTSDLALPTHLFEDHPQAGELVRFSSPDDDTTGFAFPNPRAYFNERVHRILFPELTSTTYTPQQLADIRPVPIGRRADGKWQKA